MLCVQFATQEVLEFFSLRSRKVLDRVIKFNRSYWWNTLNLLERLISILGTFMATTTSLSQKDYNFTTVKRYVELLLNK